MRYFLEKNAQIRTSYIKLTELFLQEYKDVNINYDLISLEEEKTLIENFKKRNKYNTNRDIQIRDVINIKNFSMGAIYNKKYKNRLKCNFDNLINDFKINDINIVQNLKVTFERKNKLYNKDIYCMMSKEMEENIKSPENTQYFSDVTYYCVPLNNKKHKLFTTLAFNKRKYHTVLCNLSMIQNENIETFYTVLEHLKNRYNFNPKNITIDFSKAEYGAYKKIFNDITIN